MHMFLYQAARHVRTNKYTPLRYSQTSIRNDFDLELLKRGIKGRYTIVGCGLHPFQIALKQIGLQNEFYGHVIEIEDSKNAVWFKLNYDNIGKHQTKYLGAWRDLDPEAIADQTVRYHAVAGQLQTIRATRSSLSYQYSSVNGFWKMNKSTTEEALIKLAPSGDAYLASMKTELVEYDKRINALEFQLNAIYDEVKNYMTQHKG